MNFLFLFLISFIMSGTAFSQELEVVEQTRKQTFKKASIYVEGLPEVFIRLTHISTDCNIFSEHLKLFDVSEHNEGIHKEFFAAVEFGSHYIGCYEPDFKKTIVSNVISVKSVKIPVFDEDSKEESGSKYVLRFDLLYPDGHILEVLKEKPHEK